MFDVIDSNFEEVLKIFEHQLKKCSFLAVDCEFTSLPNEVDDVPSFQDSGKERYQKMRQHISHCTPLQVGMTLFTYDRDLTEYKATIFKFHVCPPFFGLFDMNIRLKSSSVQFLKAYNFDFNKVFHHGIPYLSKTQCQNVCNQLNKGLLLEIMFKALHFDEREDLASYSEAVRKWITKSSVGDVFVIPSNQSLHMKYVVHKEIRKQFNNVWTKGDLNSTEIMVEHVSEDQRHKLQSSLKDTMDDELLKSLRGFSRVMDVLVSARKPIVGHNMLIDLLSCYHHFCAPLPKDYHEFKTCLNELFPALYDTKLISFEMKRLAFRDVLDNISLQNLYVTFQGNGKIQSKPSIRLSSSDGKAGEATSADQHSHDAGWDSYMTGFCFLKMMHLLKSNEKALTIPYSNKELMASADIFKNQVNLSRALIPYMQLDGPDPDSKRPPHLVVSSNTSRLNFKDLDELLLEVGYFQVKPLSPFSATVAAPNYSSLKSAVKKLRIADYKVEAYCFLKHHRVVRSLFLVGCTLLPASLSIWYYFKLRR